MLQKRMEQALDLGKAESEVLAKALVVFSERLSALSGNAFSISKEQLDKSPVLIGRIRGELEDLRLSAQQSLQPIEQKLLAQRPPADKVADKVQHEIRDRRGNAEPMIQHKRNAEDAALRHVRLRMDVIQTKGQHCAAHQR